MSTRRKVAVRERDHGAGVARRRRVARNAPAAQAPTPEASSPPGAAIAEEVPVRPALPDLLRRQPLVLAVIPLDEIVVERDTLLEATLAGRCPEPAASGLA